MCRWHTTDEKRHIDRKDNQRIPSYYLRITNFLSRTKLTNISEYGERFSPHFEFICEKLLMNMFEIDKFTPGTDLQDTIGKIGVPIVKAGKEAGERLGGNLSDLIDRIIDSIF